MSARTALLGPLALLAALTGCTRVARVDLQRQTGGNAFLFHQFQAYDGHSGRPLDFAAVVRRCRQADVILFGERHNDVICNQLEAQLLYGLLADRRPLALAMEFFEADQQAALDAYLTGRIDEADFIEQARRRRSYYLSHRPLIELCRAARVPVIAANAPRRLVRAFRRSGAEYGDFRADLTAEQRQWLPPDYVYLEGEYRARFAAAMGADATATAPASQPGASAATQPAGAPASAPSGPPHNLDWREFYKAQLLWDEAMSDAIVVYRQRHPASRVMLIVGGFHVEFAGGTMQKLRRRRPHDRIVTLTYRTDPDGQFAFDPNDQGAADVVFYGVNPPEPEEHREPASQPASQPVASQPAASQPGHSSDSRPAARRPPRLPGRPRPS